MGRKKFYDSIDEMKKDLKAFLQTYNIKRPHHGQNINGKTPAQVFKAGLPKPTSKPKKRGHTTKSGANSDIRSGHCQVITVSAHINLLESMALIGVFSQLFVKIGYQIFYRVSILFPQFFRSSYNRI